MTDPFVLSGPINRDACEAYLQQVLIPEPRTGDIVVAGNLSSHTGPRTRALTEVAGGGAEALSEEVTGRVWFRRARLDDHGLDPARCAVIGVRGCSILIGRARVAWRVDAIFVLRTPYDGLIVKRAGQDDDGTPTLVSAHPDRKPVPLPAEAEIIGQVVWTARTLMNP